MQSFIGVEDNFLLENGYLVARLEEIVLAAEDTKRFTADNINEIFRIMHTIKSSAGIMMYENISILAHKLEDVFYYLRETYPESVPHDELVERILATADFITAELVKIKAGEKADGDAAPIIDGLTAFLAKIKDNIGPEGAALPENVYIRPEQFYVAPKAGEAKKYYRIDIYYRLGTEMSNVRAYTAVHALREAAAEIIFTPEEIATDNDTAGTIMREGFHIQIQSKRPLAELRELVEGSSGEKEIEISDSSVEEFLLGFPEKEGDSLIIRLDDDWQEGEAEEELVPGAYVIKKEAGKGKTLQGSRSRVPPAQDMISIPLEKIDRLAEYVEQLAAAGETGQTDLSRLIGNLREAVQSMRKVPMKSIFHKMNRAVYDISRKLDKMVELETDGENVEIDRNASELLSDSLIHILRNAVDHGIEDKRERLDRGKAAKGKVLIRAEEQGNDICVSIDDDGRGLETEQIFAAAKARNLTGGKDRQQFSDKDIYQFILYPGFSTNRQVTEYSGRGVGLDIVAHNLQALGGKLEVDSTPGEGTTMLLRIPGQKREEE